MSSTHHLLLLPHTPTNPKPLKSTTTITSTLLHHHHPHHHLFKSMQKDLKTHLHNSIPKTPPLEVTNPMHHLLSSAPTTMAPYVCLAASDLVGGRRDVALDVASALHLMHTAAWAHGRLIGLDLTTTLTYSPGVELLTGDGVFPLGFEIVARNKEVEPEVGVKVVMEMVEMMGGIIEGQLGRVEGGVDKELVWKERVEERLCGCGGACGVMVGGGGEEMVEKGRRVGMYLGAISEVVKSGKGLERVERLKMKVVEELEVFDFERRKSLWDLLEFCLNGQTVAGGGGISGQVEL
ncbi:geranylgeranyl diphosphate synthase type II protein [Dioscorea alata]|uniref:Geranylgeranyl diphosphate synthase type II protein n=1 Tax=Dioscorea alata TaxID=55571 RepID=A0ACB7UHD0_DIOAL|nr:geranylgeranyl diphosphate synthase type II protein [Dioscorea alata]